VSSGVAAPDGARRAEVGVAIGAADGTAEGVVLDFARQAGVSASELSDVSGESARARAACAAESAGLQSDA
jgi:hypothetical protein